MFETLGFCFIALTSGLIKHVLSPVDNLAEMVFQSASGEGLEELLENILQGEIVDFVKKPFRVGALKKEQTEKLRTFFGKLEKEKTSPDEKKRAEVQAFADFFKKAELKPEYKKAFSFESDRLNNANGGHKKGLFVSVKRAWERRQADKKRQDMYLAHVESLSTNQLIDNIFICVPVPIPGYVEEYFGIIKSYDFGKMFVSLSKDDREMSKLLQYMMDDSNDRCTEQIKMELDSLRKEIGHILQCQASTVEAELSPKAEGKLWLYVPAVCPHCGAEGGDIVKLDGRMYCRCCNRVHDMISGVDDDEIKKQLDEVRSTLLAETEKQKREMLKELRDSLNDASDEGRAELERSVEELEYVFSKTEARIDKLAATIVTESFMEGKLRQLADSTELGFEEAKRLFKVESRELKEHVEIKTKAVVDSIRASVEGSEMRIIEKIRNLHGLMDTAFDSLRSIRQDVTDLKEQVRQVLERFPKNGDTSYRSLEKAMRDFLKSGAVSDRCDVDTECPACHFRGSLQQSHVGDRWFLICPDCGCRMDASTGRSIGLIEKAVASGGGGVLAIKRADPILGTDEDASSDVIAVEYDRRSVAPMTADRLYGWIKKGCEGASYIKGKRTVVMMLKESKAHASVSVAWELIDRIAALSSDMCERIVFRNLNINKPNDGQWADMMREIRGKEWVMTTYHCGDVRAEIRR